MNYAADLRSHRATEKWNYSRVRSGHRILRRTRSEEVVWEKVHFKRCHVPDILAGAMRFPSSADGTTAMRYRDGYGSRSDVHILGGLQVCPMAD
ncbi:MAG: hypothetical protein ABFD46_05055 [Armatimonadota bacterium]